MSIYPETVGIDVAKAHLDIHFAAQGCYERIANTQLAVAELAARCQAKGAFVLFEATGRYDARLRQALGAAGVAFARVNPARARDFAKAAGFLAKTDKVDARMLARMASALEPTARPPADTAREQLATLHRRRDQLVDDRSRERVRRSDASADERDSLDRHIAWLSAEIACFDKRIASHLASAAGLKETWLRLRSAPGIGPVAATTLVALMPELGCRSSRTIAALAGLAPLNRDSGQLRGLRRIGGGRRRVRQALYMAAVTAARSKSRFAAFYRSLRAAGKPAKLALIAVARKLLISLNAMVREGALFHA
jgi:transposase